MRPIKFKVPVFAIQKLPGEEDKRVCIGIFPIRGFWDDLVVIQMDEIIQELDKHFPDCEHHGEGTFKDSEGCCNIHLKGCESSNEWDDFEFSMNQIELLQFTGLLDKNGKEIFEGDIVEWDDGSNGKWRRRCEIKWEKTKYILVGYYYNANIPDSKKTPIDFKFGSFIYEYDGAMEIIGSIYENPDLLNKQ